MTDEGLALAVGFKHNESSHLEPHENIPNRKITVYEDYWQCPDGTHINNLPDFNSLDGLAKWVWQDNWNVHFVMMDGVCYCTIVVPRSNDNPGAVGYSDDANKGIACRKACEQVLRKED